MNHNKISLNNLTNNIKNNQYAVPVIQGREGFTGRAEEVEMIGDSVIRGIPIAPLVIMPYFSHIPCSELHQGQEFPHLPFQSLVIDGVRRITFLSHIFLNSGTETYYFDLLSVLNEYFLKEQAFSSRTNSYLSCQEKVKPISDVLCCSFRQGETGNNSARFILSSSLISNNFTHQIRSFLAELRIECDFKPIEVEEYFNFLCDLLTAVSSYRITCTTVNLEPNLEDIQRCCSRLNTPNLHMMN